MAYSTSRLRESAVSLVTLISSAGTLVCCALPILLVSFGMGAAVVSLTSTAPWLITLSEHKPWVFSVSLFMLVLCGWAIYRPGRSCPSDPQLARACRRADRINRWVYWASILAWSVGFFSAFLLNPITRWLGA